MESPRFMRAAIDGDLDLVRSLLAKDSSEGLLNCRGDDGNTALLYACSYGHEQLVRYLLTKAVNTRYCNDYGWTLLMIASYYGHQSIVLILLKNSCRPNYVGLLGCTALQCAARCNHLQIADLLIAQGADVNMTEGYAIDDDSRSKKIVCRVPLMTAVQHGHDAMVALLVSKGADVNYRDPRTGWTPLMMAALNGHTTAVQILIKNGADCDMLSNLGQTALEVANKMKRRDVANVLDDVTTIRVQDSENLLVTVDIVEAARKGDLEQIKELSKKNDFNVNETRKDGVTPLMCATAGDHFRVVLFLLEKHADVNSRDETRGWTALMYATEKNHKSIICLLILYGANVELQAFDKLTAFDVATVIGDSETIRILVAGSYNSMLDVSKPAASGTSSNARRNTQLKFVQKMLEESLIRENKNMSVKYSANGKEMQFSDMYEANRQGLKVLFSKGLNKLWSFNRTVRGLNKKQTSKPLTYQAGTGGISDELTNFSVDSSNTSHMFSRHLTSGEQLSSVITESSGLDSMDQKKTARLPLAGPSVNLWCNELNNPVVPPFKPTTAIDFNTRQRELSESLLTLPQVPAVFINGSVYDADVRAGKSRPASNLIHDSDYFSNDSKRNDVMFPASSPESHQELPSPESSFSFSTAASPYSSFTDVSNTRTVPYKRDAWSPVSRDPQNQSTLAISNASLPSFTSSPPTNRHPVPKTSKLSSEKRKFSSLPRIGRSSVAPVSKPRGLSKSEPDEEEMRKLLERLSLQKYTQILEEEEVDLETFVTLDEDDLHQIGIDHDKSKQRILDAVHQLRKQKERSASHSRRDLAVRWQTPDVSSTSDHFITPL